MSQGQTKVFFLCYTAAAQFVLGKKWFVPGTTPGSNGSRKKGHVLNVYANFSLPRIRKLPSAQPGVALKPCSGQKTLEKRRRAFM